MNLPAILQAVATILTPLIAAVGVLSRKPRLRNSIKENLALAEELNKNELLRTHTPVSAWMHGQIVVDVAKLTGTNIGTPKKPIPKGALALAAILVIVGSGLAYYLSRDGFVWYSIFPATFAFMMFISILGMFTNREIPPEESNLPAGATPMRTTNATERIASALAFSDAETAQRLSNEGQSGAALAFLKEMRLGNYEGGLRFADQTWLMCRIQSWLFNNREVFGSDLTELQKLADSLAATREPANTWKDFTETEAAQFKANWEELDPEKLGIASRQRVIAPGYERVILVPLSEAGGYYVNSPTMLTNALTFVVHEQEDRWVVANHLGTAAPVPGWPPAWWEAPDTTQQDESS